MEGRLKIGHNCMEGNCVCRLLDGWDMYKKGSPIGPPIHEDCDCYIEERYEDEDEDKEEKTPHT